MRYSRGPLSVAEEVEGRENDEKRLLRHLMRGYERDVRPVKNASTPVVIQLSITLTQIFDMVSKKKNNKSISISISQHSWTVYRRYCKHFFFYPSVSHFSFLFPRFIPISCNLFSFRRVLGGQPSAESVQTFLHAQQRRLRASYMSFDDMNRNPPLGWNCWKRRPNSRIQRPDPSPS